METSVDEKIKSALECKTIVIVGISREPNKDSHKVAKYLKANGYRIVPINPFADEVLGEKCYKNLLEIPEEVQKIIEVVDIFRPSQEVLPIVEQAIRLKQKHGKPLFIWMQLGVVNVQAAELAEKTGLKVIMDRCMMIEHKRFKRENLPDERRLT
ncbi:MAG: CoA-binding protein [Candidatus Brockarchaeota archaeon]|nr:CoA-binding protein [Candidatus Brockarchaeota archaeon]